MVDPGQSTQVVNYITEHNLVLKSILITHSHNDHIGGVQQILNYKNVPVYRATNYDKIYSVEIKFNSEIIVTEGNLIELFSGVQAQIIATPGHTFDGISFLVDNQHLFCGDTLFSAGCGRVFTKDYLLMYDSLQKIKQLDSETLIYPGHEYTLNNLLFTQSIEPNNTDIIQQIIVVQDKINTVGNSLPTTLGTELKTNPFLRCNNQNILNFACTLDSRIKTELDCFVALRNYKDTY